MFKNLGNFAEMLKVAGRVRSEMKRIDEELKQMVVDGSAGGGMVKVRMTGKQELLDCKIDPQVFAEHDAEMLEDLVAAAVNQAMQKSREAADERRGKVADVLDFPGLSDALSRLSGGDAGS